ncbi:hypothetical protein P3674_25565, partial [Vibrio parahaemolyticus]|nr:hypothetical protein [Vibrio parahaemolyticus]
MGIAKLDKSCHFERYLFARKVEGHQALYHYSSPVTPPECYSHSRTHNLGEESSAMLIYLVRLY